MGGISAELAQICLTYLRKSGICLMAFLLMFYIKHI